MKDQVTATINENATRKGLKIETRVMTGIAMLSAISFVLTFLKFPMPLAPSFANLDFSDLPAMIATFAYGPFAGVLVELIKNILQLSTTATGGIGELANFIMGGSFALTAGLLYKQKKTKKRALVACLVASIVMGITAALANYFILLPLYTAFLPMDEMIAMFTEIFPFIHSKLDVVLFSAFPGNVLKGIFVSVITMLIYKPLSPILKGRY